MTFKKSILHVISAMALMVVCGRSAEAQSVYADSWTGSDTNDDATVTVYGYGETDADGQSGRVGVSTVIYSPSMSQLASHGDTGFDFVSAQTSINVSSSSATGDYRVEAAGDYDFNHFDCGVSIFNLTSFTDNYIFYDTFVSAGVTWADYGRCGSGSCQTVKLRRNHVNPTSGDFPTYAAINVLTITIGPATGCFGVHGEMIGGC